MLRLLSLPGRLLQDAQVSQHLALQCSGSHQLPLAHPRGMLSVVCLCWASHTEQLSCATLRVHYLQVPEGK